MNRYLLIAALLGFCAPARAQLTNAQSVKIVVPYKTTCSSVTLSTTPRELTGNTTTVTTAGISAIKIVNLSTTATVYSSNFSTVTASGNMIGDPIFPSSGQPNWMEYGISVLQGWYAIASAANTSVIVCLVR